MKSNYMENSGSGLPQIIWKKRMKLNYMKIPDQDFPKSFGKGGWI